MKMCAARDDPRGRIAEGDGHDGFVRIELHVGEIRRVAVQHDVPVLMMVPVGGVLDVGLREGSEQGGTADRGREPRHVRSFTRISCVTRIPRAASAIVAWVSASATASSPSDSATATTSMPL